MAWSRPVLSSLVVRRLVRPFVLRLCDLRQASLLSPPALFLPLPRTLRLMAMMLVLAIVLLLVVASGPALFSLVPQWPALVRLCLLSVLAILLRVVVCIPQVRVDCRHSVVRLHVAQ